MNERDDGGIMAAAGRRSPAESVREGASTCSSLLLQLGVDPSKQLGCGAYGCVYQAGRKRVAKVSFDAGEAEMAALFALSRNEHPAIPFVERVVRLPPRCGTDPMGYPLFVILREELDDLIRFIEPEAKDPLNMALGRLGENFDPEWSGTRQGVNLAVRTLSRLPRAFYFYKQALRFALWCHTHNVELGDVYLQNWGVRDGRQIVLRDFGLTSSSSPGPRAADLPALAGLGVARHLRGVRGLRLAGYTIRGLHRRR